MWALFTLALALFRCHKYPPPNSANCVGIVEVPKSGSSSEGRGLLMPDTPSLPVKTSLSGRRKNIQYSSPVKWVKKPL
ncbi:hypothetical protein BKA56DRAFT_595605 [Ilyonectria sp. MPI-CAGE-AT-0026]|nr:hypothetical protein BKA56DRAFT_595605 [Ilyonectria sp. MPI-CAGE-AT-0026]